MNKLSLTETVDAAVREIVRRVNGKYAVYPEKGGHRLGIHPTKAGANKQLQAIHINKAKHNMNELGKSIPLQGGEVDEETFKKALVGMLRELSPPTFKEVTRLLLQHWNINIPQEDYIGNILHSNYSQFDTEELYQILFDVHTIVNPKRNP